MNKYFEALERLAMPDELHIKECKKLGIGLTEDYEVVKQALLELKSIKEANPSEALECLKKLNGMEISSMPFKDDYGIEEVDLNDIRKVGSQLNTDFRENIDTIKQALLKAEKEKKIILGIEDYLNLRIKVSLVEDVRKAFIEIRNQLQVIKEVLE